MITIENLTVKYGEKTIFKNINLVLDKGLHIILGRNGSGKTTLLKTIAGIIKPSAGRVLINGRNIHEIPRSEAVKLIGYTWQNPYAGFIEAIVREEIEFTAKLTKSNINKEIVEILVPKELLDRNPFTLSGGEAKRVSIASILALDQPVWLMDEPFEYLDANGIETIRKVIEHGLSKSKVIVIASSSTSFLHLLRPSTISVLYNGEIVLSKNTQLLDEIELTKYGVPSRGLICGSSFK